MSTWQTNVTTSNFNATEKINNQLGGRNRITTDGTKGYNTILASDSNYTSFSEGTGNLNKDYFGERKRGKSSFDYSIVGIDGNQVANMRAAIEDYVQSIQNYLADAIVTSKAEISKAFRGGEAEKAVDEYLEKIKTYVHNVVSHLNAFSDKLADVGNAWVQAQSNIASNVNTSTGSFSEGSTYSTSVQYGGPSR